MNKEDVIWLSGIIDGEGCIHCHLVNKTRNLSIQVQVHCASRLMVDEIESIYKSMEVSYKRELPFRQPKSTRDTHRITVRRREEVIKLLQFISPYLRVKKSEAQYVINFHYRFINCSIKPNLEQRQEFDKCLKMLKRA